MEYTIIFEPQTITITTEVKGGKEIEVLDIEGHNTQDGSITFFCVSRGHQKITIAIPKQEQVEVIDYYYYSPERQEETQLRFHVE